MLSLFRNRFGAPGVIAVIALVFAMMGGAYAASNDSGSGGATASAKAKKGPRGPKGPKGDTGPAGPAGAAGPAGPAGLKGANGADGSPGAPGAKGATGAAGAIGVTGATGATGLDGSPWTAGGTLPSGETETGVWQTAPGSPPGTVLVPISFPIPLEAALEGGAGDGNAFNFLEEGEDETENCPGTLASPEAVPGQACIYTASSNKAPPLDFVIGSFESGAFMAYSIEEAGSGAFGSWAVTAPVPAP